MSAAHYLYKHDVRSRKSFYVDIYISCHVGNMGLDRVQVPVDAESDCQIYRAVEIPLRVEHMRVLSENIGVSASRKQQRIDAGII